MEDKNLRVYVDKTDDKIYLNGIFTLAELEAILIIAKENEHVQIAAKN